MALRLYKEDVTVLTVTCISPDLAPDLAMPQGLASAKRDWDRVYRRELLLLLSLFSFSP